MIAEMKSFPLSFFFSPPEFRTCVESAQHFELLVCDFALKNCLQRLQNTELWDKWRPGVAQRVCGEKLCLHEMLCPEIFAKLPINLSLRRRRGTGKSGVGREGRCRHFPRPYFTSSRSEVLEF